MTWQRIDENTYIDDTLITCAEYQLFIDEMREQGKYYQPDHWTLYHFSKGRPHGPVLGVRHSDAVAFCEWVSKLGNGEWNIRLPNEEEASTYQINSHNHQPFGFWINTSYKISDSQIKSLSISKGLFEDRFYMNSQFKWVNNTPRDPYGNEWGSFEAHVIVRNNARISIFNHVLNDPLQSIDIQNSLLAILERERDNHPVEANIISDSSSISNVVLVHPIDIIQDLFLAQKLAVDFHWDKDFERVIFHNRGVKRGNLLSTVLKDLENSISRDFKHKHKSKRLIGTAIKTALDVALEFSFDLIKDTPRSLFNSMVGNYLDIYIILVTLQERIAGRSPAFEGIRLVKERIK